MKNLISIIIRTKNEERWITQCLRAVSEQNYKNFEVILVDNESDDLTIVKAKQFNLAKIITCRDYLPGKALNMGIRAAKGKFIVCLSGHCIPVNSRWLENLLKNFTAANIAGVYGRQEAMSFTSNSDKRDLAIIFGLDRKVQRKDSFFHNANSMILKSAWNKINFDETVTNIEDRVWAQRILCMGYKIIYEPKASVYHYHGIHQTGDVGRCANVLRIMETMHSDYAYKSIDLEKLNTVALIPIKGDVKYLNQKPLIEYTINQAHESRYIKKVIILTDNPKLAEIAIKLGAQVPFLRDISLSKDYVDLAQVLQDSLQKLEEKNLFSDIIVLLESTFPFRPKGFLDDMIAHLIRGGFDSVTAVRKENKAIWKEEAGRIIQIEEGITPRQFKEPIYIELRGLGYVTHPEFLREGRLTGNKIGIYEMNDPYSHLEVRSEEDFRMASTLIT